MSRGFWLASCWQHEPRGGVELNTHSLFAMLLFCFLSLGCTHPCACAHLYSRVLNLNADAILAQVELSYCQHKQQTLQHSVMASGASAIGKVGVAEQVGRWEGKGETVVGEELGRESLCCETNIYTNI